MQSKIIHNDELYDVLFADFGNEIGAPPLGTYNFPWNGETRDAYRVFYVISNAPVSVRSGVNCSLILQCTQLKNLLADVNIKYLIKLKFNPYNKRM